MATNSLHKAEVRHLLLMAIVWLYSNMIAEAFHVRAVGDFGTMAWIAVVLGLLYGVGFGITGYYLDKRFFSKPPLGKVILYKAFISIALFALVLLVLRFVVFEIFI